MPNQAFIKTSAERSTPAEYINGFQDRSLAGAISAIHQGGAGTEGQLGGFDTAEILDGQLRQSHERSEPHGHYDILGAIRFRSGDQAAAIGVSQREVDVLGIDRGKRFEQIGHIEPDFDFFTAVTNFQLIFRFFLFWIVRLKRQ
jgi:hypothetical protein